MITLLRFLCLFLYIYEYFCFGLWEKFLYLIFFGIKNDEHFLNLKHLLATKFILQRNYYQQFHYLHLNNMLIIIYFYFYSDLCYQRRYFMDFTQKSFWNYIVFIIINSYIYTLIIFFPKKKPNSIIQKFHSKNIFHKIYY